MTREDAIKTLHELWRETNDPWYEEVYNMAIEALSAEGGDAETNPIPTGTGVMIQSPNGADLISRQDAIDAFGLSEKTRKYGGDHSGYNTTMLYEIQDVLESLPSAEPKTGEWVDRSDGGRIKYPWWENCKCNQCGEYGSGAYTFCPNCGARMTPYKGGDGE